MKTNDYYYHVLMMLMMIVMMYATHYSACIFDLHPLLYIDHDDDMSPGYTLFYDSVLLCLTISCNLMMLHDCVS